LDMGSTLETAVGCPVVAIGLAQCIEIREVGEGFFLYLVRVCKDFIFCHLLFGEIIAFVHLTNKVSRFGFVRDDDIYCFAFFLLFVELASEGDDVGHVWDPCLIEGIGGIRAFPGHDFAPFRA
jgi:hypothetical protein